MNALFGTGTLAKGAVVDVLLNCGGMLNGEYAGGTDAGMRSLGTWLGLVCLDAAAGRFWLCGFLKLGSDELSGNELG